MSNLLSEVPIISLDNWFPWSVFCYVLYRYLWFLYFNLVGMLLGIAIRTGSPLSLSLAEPVWKQLAGMPLNVSDLTEVDKDYVPGRPI